MTQSEPRPVAQEAAAPDDWMAEQRTLYDFTGDVKDVNTLLVNRGELVSRLRVQGEGEALPPLLKPALTSWYGPSSEFHEEPMFDADQMREYVLADRASRQLHTKDKSRG